MTYNLIKKSISEEKPFKVGVFAGLSKSKKIVPYGLAIMRE
jgi:hypothetical protein